MQLRDFQHQYGPAKINPAMVSAVYRGHANRIQIYVGHTTLSVHHQMTNAGSLDDFLRGLGCLPGMVKLRFAAHHGGTGDDRYDLWVRKSAVRFLTPVRSGATTSYYIWLGSSQFNVTGELGTIAGLLTARGG
jgi:hypothetical protein